MNMLRSLPLVLLLVLFASCGAQPAQNQNTTETQTSSYSTTGTGATAESDLTSSTQTTPMQTDLPQSGDTIVEMETTLGTIKIKFFPQYAPNTVANFLGLAGQGFYDGLLFHRVIADFMIQGGDPEGNGTGGKTYQNKPLKDEISPALKHIYGAVSMANAGPNTASSQFFIVQNKNGAAYLDGGYTVFGQVYEGMEVVERIAQEETVKCAPFERKMDCDRPLKDIKMNKVVVKRYE